MAKHALFRSATGTRRPVRSGSVMAGLVLALSVSLLGGLPASAAPTDPNTSQDAKKAWEQSDHQAEVASEALNVAKSDQRKAQQQASAAAAAVVAARKAVQTAQHKSAAADSTVSGYQAKLDQFANASFRGARLSDMSALLTANSADDFLDQATAIDRVAADTHKTLDSATAARSAAVDAKTAATAAEVRAEQAKSSADAAKSTADQAAAAAAAKKSELDGAVAKYKSLFSKLSAQERAAAAAEAARIRQESEAAAARAIALQQQQAADAAAAAAAQAPAAPADPAAAPAAAARAAAPSSQSSSSSSSAAPAPAASGGGDQAGQIAAAAAMTKIGGSYCYGCDGPSSFDCSGLTTWAWAQAGVSIPRTSAEEANFESVPLDQLQPGDLVTYYSPVSHVAIYVGNGMVVSAADESLGIIFVPVERGGPDASGHRVPRG